MVQNWWEIRILCDPALEDLVFWRLETFECRGMSSQSKGNSCLICAYLPQEQVQLLDLAALSLWLRQDALCVELSPPATQWDLIDEEDWASSWKQYWHPIEIGDRFLICPVWLSPPQKNDRLLLRLDPGAAFGTGSHPTTQLCLEALEMRLSVDPKNLEIADIGCGSGILSIGALQLGVSQVYAVDTDSLSVRSARRNRELNRIAAKKMIVEQGSIDRAVALAKQPVDGILCNILAEVIVDLIPHMDTIVKPTTWGIFSGILLDQAKHVADVLEQHGWIVATLWRKEDWCCFNVRRS